MLILIIHTHIHKILHTFNPTSSKPIVLVTGTDHQNILVEYFGYSTRFVFCFLFFVFVFVFLFLFFCFFVFVFCFCSVWMNKCFQFRSPVPVKEYFWYCTRIFFVFNMDCRMSSTPVDGAHHRNILIEYFGYFMRI